jgi:hypothetical protein
VWICRSINHRDEGTLPAFNLRRTGSICAGPEARHEPGTDTAMPLDDATSDALKMA